MTVQFVARFSLSFLWYFQKNVTEPDGPPSPATPKVSFTFKEKRKSNMDGLAHASQIFLFLLCLLVSELSTYKGLWPCLVLGKLWWATANGHVKKRYEGTYHLDE